VRPMAKIGRVCTYQSESAARWQGSPMPESQPASARTNAHKQESLVSVIVPNYNRENYLPEQSSFHRRTDVPEYGNHPAGCWMTLRPTIAGRFCRNLRARRAGRVLCPIHKQWLDYGIAFTFSLICQLESILINGQRAVELFE
jgi:hypothetical protein